MLPPHENSTIHVDGNIKNCDFLGTLRFSVINCFFKGTHVSELLS